jgi:hypothetical protein
MTPQEKAKELISKFQFEIKNRDDQFVLNYFMAKILVQNLTCNVNP